MYPVVDTQLTNLHYIYRVKISSSIMHHLGTNGTFPIWVYDLFERTLLSTLLIPARKKLQKYKSTN